MRITLTLFLIFTGYFLSSAQTFQPKQYQGEETGVVYNREFSINFKLHTNGPSFPLALGANFGKLRTYYKSTYMFVEVGEIRHPKEFRQSVNAFSLISARTPRAFMFGKHHNFYVLRGGWGGKKYLTEKARQRGVAVGYSYQFGPALGLLKPYYLELFKRVDNGSIIATEKYSEETASRFLDRNFIYGASSFSKGFGELTPRPGLHSQISLHLDWGAFDELVKALEVGLMAEFFFTDVPIIVENENITNSPLFLNLFISLQLGRRW
jgi:hypothetical protein